MSTYSHAYTLVVEIKRHPDYKGVLTAKEIREAIAKMSDEELVDATGLPFDTTENND